MIGTGILNADSQIVINDGGKNEQTEEAPIPPPVEEVAAQQDENHSRPSLQDEIDGEEEGREDEKGEAIEQHDADSGLLFPAITRVLRVLQAWSDSL